MNEQFVHCHVHSQYSIIDGRATIERYMNAAKEDGQPALALTDHGSISGAIELYTLGRKHGVTPIIGSEIYIDHLGLDEDRPHYPDHLTVLVKNERGYRDLVLGTTMAAQNFYYRPRLYFAEVEQNHLWRDWFILSGCESSTVNKLLKSGDIQAAFNLADVYAKHAGGYALEIQPHTPPELAERIKELHRVSGIPLVLTQDCHYNSAESEAIRGKLIEYDKGNDPRILHGVEFDGTGLYWRSTREMYEIADRLGLVDAARETVKIANQCQVSLPEVDDLVWDVPVMSNDPARDIDAICRPKLAALGRTHSERYTYEMSVLSRAPHIMQSYLVAFDIITWCHSHGIAARCRGSMAGSIVSYLLGISRDDPVAFNLKFERAVNPARPTIPDFDLDVSSARRQEVLQYILSKWPKAKPIVTFQSYHPHGAARQVMRVYNYEQFVINGVTKVLPDQWSDDIDWKIIPPEIVPTIQDYQGLFATMSIHAAALSLNTPSTMIPLTWIASSNQFVTGYDMYSLKKIGNFKMDILGLTTLDQITFFEESTGVKAPTDYTDTAVFKALSSGKTAAIFQLDGYAAGNCIRTIGGIDNFESIVACNALARPGAIEFAHLYRSGQTGYIDQYPALAPVLGYSNGVVLYQEQAMEITRILAGFDDLEQDEIKEATKNKSSKFSQIEPRFLERSRANGHDGQAIWDAIKQFSGYAFNRAHAVAYAGVAYQLAWFKVHYPTHFYAGVFDAYEDRMRLVVESYGFNVQWELPDINRSASSTRVDQFPFETDSEASILLGLGAIKGISTAVSREVMAKRPFRSVEDFEERVEKRKCNARHKQILYDAGCFRQLGVPPKRERLKELLGINPCALQIDQFVAALPRSMDWDVLAGFVSAIKPTTIKKQDSRSYGKEMGIVTVLNTRGLFRASLFPEQWNKFKLRVHDGDAVWFKGTNDGDWFRVDSGGIIT